MGFARPARAIRLVSVFVSLALVAMLWHATRSRSEQESDRRGPDLSSRQVQKEHASTRHRNLQQAKLAQLTALYQPKITLVGEFPATKAIGSVARPEGTEWCLGRPAIWFIGHQCDDERPWCQYPNGTWAMSATTVLDRNDTLNSDNDRIDRHDCSLLDINRDGVIDIVCFVGADKGLGNGYNEVYLTQTDGSLLKILNTTLHGLAKYPTMRTRIAATLRGPQQSSLVFIGVKGEIPRTDGLYNFHTMFRNDFNVSDPDQAPWFSEVQPDSAPWQLVSEVLCAVAADITGNGLDDLILCQQPLPPAIFTQGANGTWGQLSLPTRPETARWSNVRVADVTGDGRKDLVAVDYGETRSTLWVFSGLAQPPYFNFTNPWYKRALSFAALDLEVLDVNGDGRADIYVVQSNHSSGYCRNGSPNAIWGGGPQPPLTWVPPIDGGKDILFLGKDNKGKVGDNYWPLVMGFTKKGCGNMAIRFGSNRAMALANGDFSHPGQHMYLNWP